MLSGYARWLLLAGFGSSVLLACSSDSPGDGNGAAGSNSAGAPSAGSSSTAAGSGNSAGSQSSAGQAGSSSAAGSGGASGGSSSMAGAGGAAAGAGGASGGASGGNGGSAAGSGGGAALPTAVANITGVNGKTVTGTATFTQGPAMTTLVLELTACPNGGHASHLHEKPDCGMEGNAAGGHWMPNGIDLGDYTCADMKVTHTLMKPTALWTVGDGSATDVTKHAFMVHESTDASGNPGGRIGCGVPMKK